MHSRDIKEMANDFSEFFTSVGDRSAEVSKRHAVVNDLSSKCPLFNYHYT